MSIQVTPIPRVTPLAAPTLTLGANNVAGSAHTAIASDSTLGVLVAPGLTLGLANGAGSAATTFASDSTLLAFDTILPDAITFAQSGATGSATVASRRDHAHAMQGATITDYSAKRKLSANQDITNGAVGETITWGTLVFDTGSWTSGSDQRYTASATTAGKSIVIVSLRWEGHATGDRQVMINHSADGMIGKVSGPANGDVNNETEQCVSALADLADGEYIFITAAQQSGGDLEVHAGNTQFAIIRIAE